MIGHRAAESPVPTVHWEKPYALGDNDAHEQLSSSGFHEESCRSAAAASLTLNTLPTALN